MTMINVPFLSAN